MGCLLGFLLRMTLIELLPLVEKIISGTNCLSSVKARDSKLCVHLWQTQVAWFCLCTIETLAETIVSRT